MFSWGKSYSEYPPKWNDNIRLLVHDRLLAATLFKLFPAAVTPNSLTITRFILTFPTIILLVMDNYRWGVPLFLLAALTDVFDGSLARVRRRISEWGIIFDPVVDKLLIGSAVIVVVLRHVNLLLGLALLAVEAGIIFASWRQSRRGVIVPATWSGKVKMVFEVVGVLVLLIALWSGMDLLVDISTGTLALALIFAIYTVLIRLK